MVRGVASKPGSSENNNILAEAVDRILIGGSDAEERREGANDEAKSPQQAERTCQYVSIVEGFLTKAVVPAAAPLRC